MGHVFLTDSEGGEQCNLKLLCPDVCVGALLHENQDMYSKASSLVYNLCRYQVLFAAPGYIWYCLQPLALSGIVYSLFIYHNGF